MRPIPEITTLRIAQDDARPSNRELDVEALAQRLRKAHPDRKLDGFWLPNNPLPAIHAQFYKDSIGSIEWRAWSNPKRPTGR